MPDNELDFPSLNPYTGMVESVEDMRKAGVGLARSLQLLLSNPFIQVVIPPELLMPAIAYSVKMESLFRFMSQAEEYRKMMTIDGAFPEIVTMYEQMVGGLSETLPASHPEVRGRLTRILRERGLILPTAEQEQEQGPSNQPDMGGPTEPLPPLPPDIERFLSGLGMGKEEDEHGADDTAGGA